MSRVLVNVPASLRCPRSPSSSPTSTRSAASRRTRSRPTAAISRRSPSSATGTTAAPWTWTTVDRLGIRGFLGELQRRGLAKRSAARALSAVRSLYRYLQEHHGVTNNVARAARVPKLDKRLPTYLDRDQTEPLFDWAEARAAGDDFAADARPGDARAVLLHRASGSPS